MILKIKNYTKKIKGKTVLNNINLMLCSGNIYGLYGRNGSGKTMLLRAVSTLILPDNGDVQIDGYSIIENDFDLSRMGVLIENPGFYNNMTGYENLKLLFTINHKEDKLHIDNVLKKVGLAEVKDKKYKTYSLGMKQRLAIAQAIMEEQEILLLDEPTNGLDEDGINDIRKIIMQEKEKGKIIILASHNKEDLKFLCDTIYKIELGSCNEEIKL